MRDETRCVHHPVPPLEGFASLTVPTYRASTITFPDEASYTDRAARLPDGYSYGLYGTPTSRSLAAQIGALEGTDRTLLVPSGQAAIAVVMLAVLGPGDRVLIPDSVYPPVRQFCTEILVPRGIVATVYDPLIGEGIGRLIDAHTRLVWVESPGSTTMEVQDLPAIVKMAHAAGAMVGCDNTWATPLLFKPLAHGADFSVEAITKYIGGHSDLLMGSISVRDPGLHRELSKLAGLLGIGVSPDDCSLALRGLETLAVRLERVGRHAAEIARHLERTGRGRVLHPALPDSPGHAVWARDFAGSSGVFSVVLPPERVSKVFGKLPELKVFAIGSSWGGTRSVVSPRPMKGERTVSDAMGTQTLLRISIGLEDIADLLSDLDGIFG